MISRMITGCVLLSLGFGLAYAGLGLAGVLTDNNLDVGGLFKEHIPDQASGFAAVGAGLLSALLALAITGPYGNERDYSRYDDLEEEDERERED